MRGEVGAVRDPATGVASFPVAVLPAAVHAHLNLVRHGVVPHDGAAVAQAAGLALDHEHPQGVAGFADQLGTALLVGVLRCGVLSIIVAQRLQRGLETSAEAPKRGGLLRNDLVFERVGGSAKGLQA
jgi:hypothetical protein